jgi:hypothetical protein
VNACPACGEQNPVKAKFCLECGVALPAAEARGEERKLVTVLFADIALAALLSGTTPAAERALAEQRLKTPWSACALNLLRANWSQALEAIRAIGSVPYEAAILEYVGQRDDVAAGERATQ